MADHCSILAWEIPWTEKPGRLQSIGSQRVGHDRSDLAHTHTVFFKVLYCKIGKVFFIFCVCLYVLFV